MAPMYNGIASLDVRFAIDTVPSPDTVNSIHGPLHGAKCETKTTQDYPKRRQGGERKTGAIEHADASVARKGITHDLHTSGGRGGGGGIAEEKKALTWRPRVL